MSRHEDGNTAQCIHHFEEVRDEEGEREISVRILYPYSFAEVGRISFVKERWVWQQRNDWRLSAEQLREIADQLDALNAEPKDQS